MLDQKTKPVGSLGELEELAKQLCRVQNTLHPQVDPVRVLIFAADHGVVVEGVSLFPSEVTGQMVRNFAAGGAAISVLARCFDVQLEVIDVGVNADLLELQGIVHAKVAMGTGNLRRHAAMERAQMQQALAHGAEAIVRAHAAGVRCVVLGEMGIANTTAAAALICALLGLAAEEIVGAGTGVSGEQLRVKQHVVRDALQRAQGVQDVETLLCELGGYELVALCGAMLEAESLGLLVVVDGFIVTAAALAAVRLRPRAREAMIFAHRSAERGHSVALQALKAAPLLSLGLRLGEGSGGALAIPLLRAAAAIVREMASFASAGVSGRVSPHD